MSMALFRQGHRRDRGPAYWQPAPVQVQDPAGQFVNEQVDPCAHARMHPPAEQSTLQTAPAGHDVLQWPLEQATLQVPSPQ